MFTHTTPREQRILIKALHTELGERELKHKIENEAAKTELREKE